MSSIDSRLRFDFSYLSTPTAMVKISCLILAIASIIANNVGPKDALGALVFYNVVVIMGFWYTLILLIFYVIHLVEKLYGLPWLVTELICTAIIVILYIISSIICIATGLAAQIVAGIFGLCTLLLYCFDFSLKLRKWRSGELPQASITNPNPPPPQPTGVENSAFPG